jgi:parallel beta-helix repeat protein
MFIRRASGRPQKRLGRRGIGALVALLAAGPSSAASSVVPDDFPTIQAALNAAGPGDTISVKDTPGPYFEKITFPNGGGPGAYVTLQAYAGHSPILDGTGIAGSNMVLIESKSYVKVIGFEIRNNLNVNDGSGVRILGAGSNIEIRDNRIHDIRGRHAMGITVYGTEATSISNLVIDGNQIYDCEPARSEALTLNGNVELFEVTNNIVRDVNNIGIDFIGGETDIQPDPTKVARNGVCRGNQVYRARSVYGGGYAAGIYVDGGKDITIERNVVSESDLGIEIGAENTGITVRGVIVRDNLVYHNDKAGIGFGGYDASVGRVRDCLFLSNTLYRNDTLGVGLGELWIQWAEDNAVRNNIFYSTAQNVLLYTETGNLNNTLDYNLWFTDAGSGSATFVWRGTGYYSYAAYQAGAGQDANSVFANPQFVNAAAANFHVQSTSPAVDAGDPAFTPGVGETSTARHA